MLRAQISAFIVMEMWIQYQEEDKARKHKQEGCKVKGLA